jgi:hypothetical protein
VHRKVDDQRGERRRRHRRECLRAEPAGTAVVTVTGFEPLLTFPGLLTTPFGVPGRCVCPGWVSAISPRRADLDRSTLSEVGPPTGEPDAGDPPVRFGGRGERDHSVLSTPITHRWTPACAGVTKKDRLAVIPAKAGIHTHC